jgi:hypothetical protein
MRRNHEDENGPPIGNSRTRRFIQLNHEEEFRFIFADRGVHISSNDSAWPAIYMWVFRVVVMRILSFSRVVERNISF